LGGRPQIIIHQVTVSKLAIPREGERYSQVDAVLLEGDASGRGQGDPDVRVLGAMTGKGPSAQW